MIGVQAALAFDLGHCIRLEALPEDSAMAQYARRVRPTCNCGWTGSPTLSIGVACHEYDQHKAEATGQGTLDL